MRGIGGTKKRGSKVEVTCQLCGKVVTKAGLIGHMHWKHGRDYQRPMLDKGMPSYGEARRKASLYDIYLKVRESLPLESLRSDLDWLRGTKAEDKAYMAEAVPVIEAYMAEHHLTAEEVYRQLAKLYERPRVTIEDVRRITETMPKGWHKGGRVARQRQE